MTWMLFALLKLTMGMQFIHRNHAALEGMILFAEHLDGHVHVGCSAPPSHGAGAREPVEERREEGLHDELGEHAPRKDDEEDERSSRKKPALGPSSLTSIIFLRTW